MTSSGPPSVTLQLPSVVWRSSGAAQVRELFRLEKGCGQTPSGDTSVDFEIDS